MFRSKILRNFHTVFTFFVFFSLVIFFFGSNVTTTFAAGVSDMTVSLSPTTVSASTTMTINFTPNAATSYSNGSAINISWTGSTFTGGAALTCSGACTGIAGDDLNVTKTGDANFTSASIGSQTATGFTLTLSTTGALDTSNDFQIVIGGGTNTLTNPGTAQNVSVSFNTSGGTNTTTDFGTGIASVGSANQVQITAQVNSTLSFDIRTAADGTPSGFPVGCSLGTLSTTSISFCQYRLKVGTNAGNGFDVSYSADGALRKTSPSYNFTNAGSPGTGTDLSAGTEGYGANVFAGSITGTGVTCAGTYSGSCNNFYRCTVSANCGTTENVYAYASGPAVVYSATGPNNPSGTDTTNTALVTHQATPSASTPAGSYSQLITYTITGKF